MGRRADREGLRVPDGVGANAAFASVSDTASDGTNLYIADSRNDKLRKITAAPTPPTDPAAAGGRGGPVYQWETAGGSNPAELTAACQRCHADPVNTATGAFTEAGTDLSVPGRGPALALSRSYDSTMASVPGSLGYGWTDSYSMRVVADQVSGVGAMIATAPVVDVVQENGSRVAFTKNTAGGYTPASRVLASLKQNADGSWTFVRQSRNTFTFNAVGQLTTEKDLHGYTTNLAYDSNGNLATVTDPTGRALTYTWTAGVITNVVGPAGRAVSYGYDSAGNLTTITLPDTTVTTFGYDDAHRLTTMASPGGSTTTNTYDISGRVVSQADPMGNVTTFAYSGTGPTGTWQVTTTDPRGTATVETYTDSALVAETKAAGTSSAATTTYTYDPATLGVATVTDPLGRVTRTTWDAAGHPLSVSDPLGHTVTYTYDALGDVLTSTDPVGVVTTYTYNAAGDLKSTKLAPPAPAGGGSAPTPLTTSLTYGNATYPGDVTTSTDANGKASTYTYDAAGDLTAVTDPAGNKTTATYDVSGQKLTSVSARGNVSGATASTYRTTYSYDSVGRLLSVTDPLGRVSKSGYDVDGRLTSTTDPKGQVTTTSYNANGWPTTITRPDKTTITYTYDAGGLLLTRTDGAGHTTTSTYDPLGRALTSTDALGRRTVATYDLAGQQITATDALGKTTTSSYDADGQLIAVAYNSATTADVTYTYDAAGRRTTMRDGIGTTTYALDAYGRLASTTDGRGAALSYGYDADGHQTSLTYPGTTGTLTRSLDAAGRPTTLTDPAGKKFTLAWDAENHLTSITYPNALKATYTWDAAGQLTKTTDTTGSGTSTATLASFANTLDANGLTTATATTGSAFPAVTQTYRYDTLGHVTTAGTTATPTKLAYDAGDNLTTADTGATLAYDAANQLTSSTPATGTSATSTRYTYDADGQRTGSVTGTGTNAASISYTYDQAGNLTSLVDSATDPSGTSYAYDGNGLRINSSLVAADTFNRAVTSGLGATATGGAWTLVAAASNYSVTNGAARLLLAKATAQVTAYLPGVSSTDTDTRVGVSVDKLTDGAYLTLLGRRVGASSYQGTAKVAATGAVTLTLTRLDASGTQTTLQSLNVSGLQVAAGVPVQMRLKVTGTQPTTIAAKVWATGTSEPAAWQVTATDSTAALQAAGSIGIQAYLSGSATNAPVTASFTNLIANTTTQTPINDAANAQNFTWDRSTAIPMLLSDGTSTFVYGPGGLPLEQVTGTGTTATTTYLSSDTLGSTRLLTSSTTAAVVGTYTYSPYGTPTHTGATSTALGYTGQYTDPTGLVYLRARYYDPTTGQFTTPDPLLAETGQAYAYANGNPISLTDPTGAFSMSGAYNSFFTSNVSDQLYNALTTGAGKSVTEAVVGFGDGASLGFAARIANFASPGAMCTINTRSGWYIGGYATGLVASSVTPAGGGARGAQGFSALSKASSASFKTADSAVDWVPSAKHLANAGGGWSKFVTASDPTALAQEALRSSSATFRPDSRAGRFIVETDMGRAIGTKGESWMKLVVGDDGKIITGYPVKRLRLKCESIRFERTAIRSSYDLLLGVVADVEWIAHGKVLFAEEMMPVVELALSMQHWLDMGLPGKKSFSFDSMESDEPALMWCVPESDGWRIGALRQEFSEATVWPTREIVECFDIFIGQIEGWIAINLGVTLGDAR